MAIRKPFKEENPALSFITPTEESEEPVNTAVKPPKGYKYNPEYIETKSKRVQMLMQPSLHTALKQVAAKQGISVNEAMHEILKQYVDELSH